MDTTHIHTARPVDLHAVAQATRSALFGILNSPYGDGDLGCSSSQAAADVQTECITEFDSYWNVFRPLVTIRGCRLSDDGERERCDDERVNCVVIASQETADPAWNLSAIRVAGAYEDIARAMGGRATLIDNQEDICDD